MGDRCEIIQTKLIISFDKTITEPSSILIHFIEARSNTSYGRTITLKKTSFGQDSIVKDT